MTRTPNVCLPFCALILALWFGHVAVAAQGDTRWQQTVTAATEGRWSDVVAQTKGLESNKAMPTQIILLRAVGLMRLNNPNDASRVARVAIRKDPSIIEAYLTAAEADRQSNQHDSAAAVLRRALRRFPDDARLHMSLGLGLAVIGRCDEAIVSLEEAMFRRPSNLTIVKQLAQCLAAVDRTSESVDLYGQILATAPTDRAVRTAMAEGLVTLGLADSASSIYHDLWTSDSTNTHLGIAYGRALHQGKRFAEATNVLRTVSIHAPDSASVWYNLGVAAAALGQPDSAIRAYRRAIQLQPTFPEAFFNLGIAYDARGFVEDAIVAFRRCAVQRRSLASAAYNRIAEVMRNQNRIDDALEYHNQALSFDSDNVFLMAAKGHTYLLGNRFAEAIAYLEPLALKYASSADILHALGRNYVRSGRRDDAERTAQRLETLNAAFSSDIREMMK